MRVWYMLLGQSYHTPHGAGIDEYGAMVEWWLGGGKPKNSDKNLPSATLSTTYPAQTDLGVNTGLCGERQATNHLSHGTAYYW
jgi:Tfp pilus assembly protein PilF